MSGEHDQRIAPAGCPLRLPELNEIPNGACYGEGQEPRVRRKHRTRCSRRFCLPVRIPKPEATIEAPVRTLTADSPLQILTIKKIANRERRNRWCVAGVN
jgi:hypothetical protein